jgi:hypothetical protein
MMIPSSYNLVASFLAAAGLGKVQFCSSFQAQLVPFAPSPASTSTLFNRKGRVAQVPPFRTSLLASSVTEAEAAIKSETRNDGEEGIGAWIPLLSMKSMMGLGPQRITVMGIDLVVWHSEIDGKKKKGNDEDVVWTAQVDACAHRLAPLSQGRVDPKTNCVECP